MGEHGPEARTSPEALEAAARQPTALLRGKAFHEAGDGTQALRELEAVLRLQPKDVAALRLRGLVHAHVRRFSAAFAVFEAALGCAPPALERQELRYAFADAYFNAGIYDRAAVQLESLLAENPAHVSALCYRGEVLRKLGRNDDAAASFRQALVVEPKSPWAHHSLADTLVALGRDEEALREYRADLELVPRCQPARLALARLLERQGRYAEGLSVLYESLAHHLGDPEAHNGLGRLFLARGEAARAYAEFARSLDFEAANAEAREGLAAASARLEAASTVAAHELLFWRYFGWWLPAVLVAAGFAWRARRRRGAR